MRHRIVTLRLQTAGLAAVTALGSLGAQQAPAPSATVSGLLYPQFRYTTDAATKAANGGNATSAFDLERVYLTLQAPAGDRASVRVTTDVFNNASGCTGCYGGWTVRIKYAWFHYDAWRNIGGHSGLDAAFRLGLLNTVVVGHEEGFWPRWISRVGMERNGFFSSADMGAAAILTLPRAWGEVYGTVVNGGGYTQIESDPHKDWSVRLSLTPWGSADNWLKTFTISPWVYAGKSASKFLSATGSAGTDAANGLTKDRAGVFVGVRDRRFTSGFTLAQRTEAAETGSSLATRGTYDNTGTLTSAFALVRPAELFSGDPKARSRWGLLARLDTFKPFSAGTSAGAQTTGAKNQFLIAGLWWDLNQKASFSLDLQNLKPQGGSTTTESRVLFLHGQISF